MKKIYHRYSKNIENNNRSSLIQFVHPKGLHPMENHLRIIKKISDYHSHGQTNKNNNHSPFVHPKERNLMENHLRQLDYCFHKQTDNTNNLTPIVQFVHPKEANPIKDYFPQNKKTLDSHIYRQTEKQVIKEVPIEIIKAINDVING